jgi:hypothetical protein
MAKAHQYFAQQCRAWLNAEGPDQFIARAEAIERSACELMQIVVIDLTASENAQEILRNAQRARCRPDRRRPDRELRVSAPARTRRRRRKSLQQILCV